MQKHQQGNRLCGLLDDDGHAKEKSFREIRFQIVKSH
jgi:hypothetical protein